MTFAEGDAVVYLKQVNGSLHEQLRKEEAEHAKLRDWVTHFLAEELELDYQEEIPHFIGCRKCWIDWEARGIKFCLDYERERES